jgi:hypothetical protein
MSISHFSLFLCFAQLVPSPGCPWVSAPSMINVSSLCCLFPSSRWIFHQVVPGSVCSHEHVSVLSALPRLASAGSFTRLSLEACSHEPFISSLCYVLCALATALSFLTCCPECSHEHFSFLSVPLFCASHSAGLSQAVPRVSALMRACQFSLFPVSASYSAGSFTLGCP